MIRINRYNPASRTHDSRRTLTVERSPVLRMAAVLLTLLCLVRWCMTGAAAEGDVYNWYCVHAKNHVQPRADSTFDFITPLGGYYIDTKPGHTKPDDADKVVYLTFDAGYENGNVEKILDALKAEEAVGAFFILGNLVKSNPELVKRMAEEGHTVCNHSYAHKNMTGWEANAVKEELERLRSACREIGVEVAPYFRPPEGKFDRALLEAVHNMGYKTIFWSFGYADWDNNRQPDVGKAKAKILDNIHNGAVILLHPTSSTNAAVLGDVLRELKAQGYRFGTLDELTGACEADTETGTSTIPPSWLRGNGQRGRQGG